MLKSLPITPRLQSQIDRVLRAAGLYPNLDDGYGPLEREQLALADVVMATYAQQAHRLDRLPRTAKAARVSAVVEVEIRPKRRRA